MSNILSNILKYYIKDSTIVLIEDLQPFLGRFSQNVIDTAKQIGELKYRLKKKRIDCLLIKRSEIKKFVFDYFPDIVLPKIEKKISRKGLILKDGSPRKPHFVWVSDPIIEVAMRTYWKVEKPWKRNKYGLLTHSWQALALITCNVLSKEDVHP